MEFKSLVRFFLKFFKDLSKVFEVKFKRGKYVPKDILKIKKLNFEYFRFLSNDDVTLNVL